MALKFKLTTLDGLDDALKALYKKDGDGYVLDTDNPFEAELRAEKQRLAEFRDNNTSLKKVRDELEGKLRQFEGLDPDKVNQLMAAFSSIKDQEEAELLKAGKHEEWHQRKVRRIVEDHQAQLKALQTKLEKVEQEKGGLYGQVERFTIRDEVLRAVKGSGNLRDSAVDDVLLRAQNRFKLKDGKLVAMDGDSPMVNSQTGEPLTPEDFAKQLIKDAPHLFDEGGGSGGGKQAAPSRGSDGKIRIPASDYAAQGRHAEQIAKGEAIIVSDG